MPELPASPDQAEPLPLEERKFQLERDKFEFEKSKSRGLRSFNLGLIITAMIGTATIIVSYLQLQISNESSRAQIDLQDRISKQQLALEDWKAQAAKDHDERAFELDLARLMLERETDINTEDVRQIYYLRDIVMSTLPSEISIRITHKMADNAADEQTRSAWNDGYVKLQLATTPTYSPAGLKPLTVEYVVGRISQLATPDGRTRVGDILKNFAEFNINDSNDQSIFLAYIIHETGYFKYMEENFNYSANRLASMYPSRFASLSEAAQFAGNPQSVANKIYGNRLGNQDADDGWKFRGRGYLGTTGRAGYALSATLVGVDLVSDPDKLLDSKIAAREAAATLARLSKPIDVQTVVKRLQGGFNGLSEVQSIYEKLATGSPQVTKGLTVGADGYNGAAASASP